MNYLKLLIITWNKFTHSNHHPSQSPHFPIKNQLKYLSKLFSPMIHFENYFPKKIVWKFLSQEIHYQSCSLREENFKIHNSSLKYTFSKLLPTIYVFKITLSRKTFSELLSQKINCKNCFLIKTTPSKSCFQIFSLK